MMVLHRARSTAAAPAGGWLLAASLLLVAAAGSWAAVPVEESVGTARDAVAGQRAATTSSDAIDSRSLSANGTGAGQSSRLTELFYQLQVLQQEVQDLRGLVEEQNYRLERLARDQQEQYLDLDRRMQALRGGAGQAPLTAAGDSAPAAGVGSPGSTAGGGSVAAANLSEREAYSAAFDLMKQRQFEASAQGFRGVIQNYPNGAYTPNAYYWLGELQLAQDDPEAARQSFAQVVNLYPDHQKMPDALYKLGVVYHRLGDVGRAREYLNRVRSEYPQSSAAGLAQTYLAEL